MSLTKKMLIFLGSTLLTLVLILHTLTRGVMMSGFLKLERDESVESAQKTMGMLNDDLHSMELTVRDWGQWDETYKYVIDHNKKYEDDNLKALSMSAINLNIVAFAGEDGRFIFHNFIAPGDTAYSRLSEKQWGSISDEMKPAPDSKEKRSGVIFIGGKPFLAAMMPVLKTMGGGPPRGAILMGRFFDTKKAGRFSKKLALPVASFSVHSKKNPPDVVRAAKMLSGKNPVVSFAIDEEKICGYVLLNDLAGKPEMILRSTEKRDIYQQGKRFLRILLLLSAIVGLLFTGISLIFIWFKIARPMESLMREIIGISGNASRDVRLPKIWKDDLGDLAETINELLASLESSSEALRRGEARYRAVVEDQTEIICRFGKHGALSFANEACEKFILWLAGNEESPGKESAIMMDDPAIIDALNYVIRISRSNQVVEFEEKFKPPLRDPKWIHFTCRGIFDENGDVLEYQLVGRDITKRRNAELAVANAQKFAAIAQLAMGLSHEMKNPLAIIQAHVETLQENETLEESGDDKVGYSLDVIGKQAGRITDMLARISSIERIESPEPWRDSLKKHIENVLSELEAALERRRVRRSLTMPPGEDVFVETDWRRFDSVVSNLAINAAESMEGGGELNIEVSREPDGLWAKIRFSDNGMGISEENLKRVFDPFFTTKPRGMGIGLYLCKHYMEELGGGLEIESMENVGTTVTALIPVKIYGAEDKA